MDAKEVLDYLSRYPPKPFACGCARKALKPFLRSMQLVGAYHEHRYYAHFNEDEHKIHHYSNEVEGQGDDFIAYSVSKGMSVTQASDQTSTSPRVKLFTRSPRAPPRFTTNDGALIEGNNNNEELRRRDTVSSIGSLIPDYHFPAYYESLTHETTKSIPNPEPCRRSNSFFVRCGILDKDLPRKVFISLGYDLPKSKERTEDEDIGQSPPSSRSCLRNFWSDRTYSGTLMLLHWVNVLRCGMFIKGDHQVSVMTALIPVLWYVMVAAFSTSIFVSSFRRDHFYEFFIKWATLYQDPTTSALGLRGVSTFVATKVYLWVKWCTTLVNLSCLAFLMCKSDNFSAGMNHLFYLTGYRSTSVIVLSTCFFIFSSTMWIGTVCFIALLCHYIKKHFREFSRILQLHISAAGNQFPPALNLLRERHLAMCDHVTVLDRYMSLVIGAALSIFITLGCLLLYQVVKVKMDTSVMAINVMWLCMSLGLTSVATYSMAEVSVAMHSVNDDLFAIQTNHMTLEQFGQLQMFLAKVNGPNMGFTVLGLVVVTRELMLTLFGIYLTYGIVLLQFP